MKSVKNGIMKKLIIALTLVIMVTNFVMPNYVYAADDKKSLAEKLVYGISYMLRWLGDVCLETVQGIMMAGDDYIGSDITDYEIKYSPGMIFANEVPGLDINFITPMNKTIEKEVTKLNDNKKKEEYINYINDKISNGEIEKTYSEEVDNWLLDGFDDAEDVFEDFLTRCGMDRDGAILIDRSGYGWTSNAEWYKAYWINTKEEKIYYAGARKTDDYAVQVYIEYFLYETMLDDEIMLDDEDVQKNVETKSSTSIAETLRPNVATWYVALRTIALVGLLSVLVYIGIRIILSSTSAQDKAKYKKMLKDWLVAICILFMLHYIMAFMLGMTDSINKIFAQEIGESDSLMTNIRNKVKDEETLSDAGAYALMYLVLVILTITFTVQYLKRVVFMAFLTISAPLIALTYPIDKVKDGKAQAFSYWLREYTFNCLIQPVHLILYVVLLSSAIDLADSGNYLYAIVALAFFVPVEKFLKSMFGLKSESPSGALGAAAGGAMVMSMLNKIKTTPPKDDRNDDSKAIRTKTSSSSGGSSGEGSGGSDSRDADTEDSSSRDSSSEASSSTDTDTEASNSRDFSSEASSSTNTDPEESSSKIQKGDIAGRKISGWRTFRRGAKKVAKGAGRIAGGAALGGALGTLALASNIADGDLFDNPGKALGEIGASAGVGYAAGSNLTGKLINGGSKLYNWAEKERLGVEEYNNRRFDNQLYRSDGYKMIAQDPEVQNACASAGVSVQEAVQKYLEEGVTDTTKIREGLKYGVSGEEYAKYAKAGVEKGEDIVAIKSKGYTITQVAQMGKIAKHLPSDPAMARDLIMNTMGVTNAGAKKIHEIIIKHF